MSTLPILSGMRNVVRVSSHPRPISFKSSRQEGEFLAIEMLLDPELDPGDEARQWPDPHRCYPISVVGEERVRLLANGGQNNDRETPAFPCLSINDANLLKTRPGDSPTTQNSFRLTTPLCQIAGTVQVTLLRFSGSLAH